MLVTIINCDPLVYREGGGLIAVGSEQKHMVRKWWTTMCGWKWDSRLVFNDQMLDP
jgi:hypothetical protein